MKIIQLTTDYPPNPLWGMGWNVYILTQTLKFYNLDVFVGTPSKSRNLHKNIITTSKVQDKEYLSSEKYEIFNDFDKFNVWQDLLADKILKKDLHLDIIHTHNWMSWLTAKKLLKTNQNSKIITSFHFLQKQYDLMQDNPIPNNHYQIMQLEEEAIELSNKIVVLSDSQKQLLLNKYKVKDPSKVTVIPYGVYFKSIEYSEIMRSRNKNPFIDITFVGRIENDKGVMQTIEAFKKIKSDKKIKLNIVGKGPLLDKLISENNDKRIIFHGYLGRENLKDLLIKSAIFCMPSSSETLGMTVLESMYFGVVPIYTEGETIPRLFENGKQGITVKLHLENSIYTPHSVEITNSMQKLIDDPILRQRLSRNSYNLANRDFSLEAMAQKMINIYTE